MVDSGQALEAAEALESTWDPDPILQEAEQAKEKAKKMKYVQLCLEIKELGITRQRPYVIATKL